MFKSKKYSGMEESIIQFNKITGNPECAVSMKYLMHFNWNVNKAAKSYLNMREFDNSPSNKFDIGFKRYSYYQRKVLQNTERNSDPVHRKYESYCIDYEEKAHTIKKSKSNNLFEDIKPCTSSKVRFNFNKSEEKCKDVCSKTFMKPKGILKMKKIESSEVYEGDEAIPFKNVNTYELSTRTSSVFSSEKDFPKFEKLFSFGDMLDSNSEYVEHRCTSMFEISND